MVVHIKAAAAWSLPEPRSPAGRQPTSHIVQLMTDKAPARDRKAIESMWQWAEELLAAESFEFQPRPWSLGTNERGVSVSMHEQVWGHGCAPR